MSANGVTYDTPTMNGGSNSSDWIKILGGAAGGYLFRSWQDNRNNNGCNNTPYGNNNGGCCSENTLVNRFELQQEKEMAADKAEIARLKSEKYTDQAGIQVFERLTAYVDKENAKQDVLLGALTQSSIDQQVNIRGLQKDYDCLRNATKREFETMAKAVNREFANSREISNHAYVLQPEVKICGESYDIQCRNPREPRYTDAV